LEPAKLLLKKLGGWPVLEGDDWDAGSFTWLQSVYKFKEVGFSVDYFLDFSVTTDLKNSTKRTIDVKITAFYPLIILKERTIF